MRLQYRRVQERERAVSKGAGAGARAAEIAVSKGGEVRAGERVLSKA